MNVLRTLSYPAGIQYLFFFIFVLLTSIMLHYPACWLPNIDKPVV